MREKHPLVASCTCPGVGLDLATQACALTRNAFRFAGQCPTEPHWSGLGLFLTLSVKDMTVKICSLMNEFCDI